MTTELFGNVLEKMGFVKNKVHGSYEFAIGSIYSGYTISVNFSDITTTLDFSRWLYNSEGDEVFNDNLNYNFVGPLDVVLEKVVFLMDNWKEAK